MRPARLHLLIHALWATAMVAQEPVAMVHETSTAGGMRIWDFPDNGADRFWMAVVVGVGARDEPAQQAGLAHLLQHVLFLSAGSRPDAFDDKAVEQSGVVFNGRTSSEHTICYVAGHADDWRFMVEWLADHVVRPRFLQHEVERERRTVINEVAARGGPADVRSPIHESYLYGNHPLARSVGGSARTVSAIDIEDLRAFHARGYCAANMAVGFAGSVPRDECMQAIAAAFAELPRGERLASSPPKPRVGDLLPDRARTEENSPLLLGYHLDLGNAEDLLRAMAMATYFDHRISEIARRDLQLSYSPQVSLVRHRDVQRIEFRAETRHRGSFAELSAVVRQLVAELQDQPDESRLRSCMDVSARFVIGSESDLVAAAQLASWVAWHGGDVETFTTDALRLDPGDVGRAAREWLVAERMWSMSSAPLVASKQPWIVLLLIGASLGYVAFRFRRPVAARLRTWLPSGRVRSTDRGHTASADADELEREFQRYFEEEDRSRGER